MVNEVEVDEKGNGTRLRLSVEAVSAEVWDLRGDALPMATGGIRTIGSEGEEGGEVGKKAGRKKEESEGSKFPIGPPLHRPPEKLHLASLRVRVCALQLKPHCPLHKLLSDWSRAIRQSSLHDKL